jgi:putative ABC transport system permease protein
MSRFVRDWRPMLRIARREALRARGRSALVLAMIALPVLAVVALDTLGRTGQVTAREGLDRKLGSADALIMFEGDRAPVDQNPDLTFLSSQAASTELPLPTDSTITTVLGNGSRLVALTGGEAGLLTPDGVARAGAIEVDLRDPMTAGLYDLRAGRFPRTVDEIAVSVRLSDRGFAVGDTVRIEGGPTRRVAAIFESTSTLEQSRVVGLPGSLGIESTDTHRVWLAHRPGGVDWSTVRDLNTRGVYVLSRDVVENPPPASEVSAKALDDSGPDSTAVAVLALVVAMALLEVVLLAGPAFAVGARRQQRSLALILATGGERRDVKRAVLSGGLVLGSVAAVIGAVGGVVAAWLTRPLVQGFSTEVFGPFEVSVRDVTLIALCGLLSAVLAAVAPAMLAARQDVVAVLAGRRGDTRAGLRSPVLGAVLLVGGVALAVFGARDTDGGGEVLITFSAVCAVVGMVLLIPLVVSHLGRLARGLPLPARFAVRDAARHRSRTGPAVAAVAATVAGVVALGIGGASDAAERRATYTPSGPMGAAVVTDPVARPDDWTTMRAAVAARLPAARVRPVLGVRDVFMRSGDAKGPVESIDLQLVSSRSERMSSSSTSSLGASVLVGEQSLDTLGVDMSDQERERAERILARGGAVMFAARDGGETEATVFKLAASELDSEPQRVDEWTVPVAIVTSPGPVMPALAVVSPDIAERAGLPVITTALVVDGIDIGNSTEDDLREAMAGISPVAYVSVERGFQDNSTRIVLLLLGCVGGVLVLGGTLTATFLALSDARPDFATMSAVGAAPRTRRFVAASYAATIGLVGAVLGAAVGFVPGIAITYPLTGTSWLPEGATSPDGGALPDHFIDVPWLLVGGLVLLLPLVTAAIVGLTSRSRLPMVSRLS